MRPPSIEFGRVRRRLPWWVALLFCVGAGWCASEMWRLGVTRQELEALGAETEAAKAQHARVAGAKASAPPFRLPAPSARAVNEAIQVLNLPWSDLFHALDEVQSADVGVLGIEADGMRRQVRVIAEARNTPAMLSYVERLGARPTFEPGLSLVKHETLDREPERPVRFEIRLSWRDAR